MAERRVIRPTALKRLRDTYRDGAVLLPRIERHVMKAPLQDVRPDDHDMGYMHPSEMAKKDWCWRNSYYRITNTPVEKASRANPSFRMENVLTEGHRIHEKYQTWLWQMGCLWGDWLCLECGHRFGALSPTECQFCRSTRMIYKELPLRRENYLVEGHADAAVHLEDWRGLVEIKSIGIRTLAFEAPRLYQRYLDGESAEDIWFSINKPFASHMRQGMLYLWMTWPTYDQIVFIYESKFHQQVKEFVVGYNKNLIAPQLEAALEVSQAVKAGEPPDRPLWADDPEGNVCSSCEYRRTCWQLGAPDGATNEGDTKTVVVQRTTSAKRRRALRAT